MNDIFFVSGGSSAVYGRVNSTHIAPRIMVDSDDLDNVSLDLTNIDLLSNYQQVIQHDNVYFLVRIGSIKTSVQKYLSTISTAYVAETIDKAGIFSISEIVDNETKDNPITQPTISTIK